ncbi:unnamed protein product [Lota lota]
MLKDQGSTSRVQGSVYKVLQATLEPPPVPGPGTALYPTGCGQQGFLPGVGDVICGRLLIAYQHPIGCSEPSFTQQGYGAAL